MVDSQQYAQDNPDAVREVLGTCTQIPPDVAQELTLPAYQAELDRDSIERLLELGEQDGIVEGDVDLAEPIVQVT